MPPQPTKRYFCFVQDNVVGPYVLIELAGLLRDKHIDADTPLCLEGTEEWINFRDRPEYAFAQEIPLSVIHQHVQEHASTTESSWSPKKLMSFGWVMMPLLLYILYRIVRVYVVYETVHNT